MASRHPTSAKPASPPTATHTFPQGAGSTKAGPHRSTMPAAQVSRMNAAAKPGC